MKLSNAFTNSALLAQAVAAAATTSGDLTILSMNVAGLPAILNPNDVAGGKENAAKLIGSKFVEYGYDVIHVQEDFNYHAHLYSTTTSLPHRTPTSGGVPFGSGLNTLSRFPWLASSFERIKWSKSSCASEFDCLTPKGFTFMRVALSSSSPTSGGEGEKGVEVYVDFYNLHTDAGTEKGDLEARNDNLRQVAEWVEEKSKGNAVLVFGDLNSRYSRVGDTGVRSLLRSENPDGVGLEDVWVELHQGGIVPSNAGVCGNPAEDIKCEIVDKVLYRSSPLVDLTMTAFDYVGPKFLSEEGEVLSDHNPVLVNLTWSAGTKLRQSGFWGGAAEGTWFNDASILSTTPEPIRPSKITFRGGSRLDSVSLTVSYSGGQGTTELVHGGRGGTESSLTLEEGEYWVKSELCKGEKNKKVRNFYVKATTSKGRTVESGTRTQECKVFEAEEGWQVVGFLGESGDEVDLLGFVYGRI
ncbi:Endonuclease/exonuclease/phosphatase [Sordaria brevicollis]|uniref:Endonuclease/exonuclease/phosphatase n=1 Tax=Sordaria brevicollis TaxID=83679 RepID=A0AAE0PB76_SORBR|nr:Endonuclease/exonuclease/phosphatase [Sordaria brevicollis]